jgi:hypothetical protein
MMDLGALGKPFPRNRISWRAQTVSQKADGATALALAYIDARDVADRLDEVVGPENWQCRYAFSPDGKKTLCEIGIRCGDTWIWKADGAGDSDIEAEKGALSDAFKRAAVKWGIARYLYDLKSPWVPCEVGTNGKWRRFTADPWNYVRDEPANGASRPQDRASSAGQQRAQQGVEKAETQRSAMPDNSAPVACIECGVVLQPAVIKWCEDKGWGPLCREHQPKPAGAHPTLGNAQRNGL